MGLRRNSQHTRSLLIFHQKKGYLRKVLQCCAEIPVLNMDLHTGGKKKYMIFKLRYSEKDPKPIHKQILFCATKEILLK